MSHVDAKDALKIYRHFCKQTERVSEYLDVAKKLQNLLNIPVPPLKQARHSYLSFTDRLPDFGSGAVIASWCLARLPRRSKL